MRWRLAAACALTTVLACAGAARADLVELKDGRLIDGVKMQRDGDALVLEYENGTVRVPMSRVAEYSIEGEPPPEPRTEEEKARRAEGMVLFRGKWMKRAARNKKLAAETAARKQAVEDYKSHQVWRNRYQWETKNFEFHSTLRPETNERLADLLETYYKEFGKVWKVKRPKDWGKLKVHLHRNREDFQQIGGVSGGIMAYYRFVEPREIHCFWDGRNPANTVNTLFHEANHYLVSLVHERFKYPHWINEGMAEYFAASIWDTDGKRMLVGALQQGRLQEVRGDIDKGKRYELDHLIGGGSSDYEHYYWGWSFVHFMMHTPKYTKNFQKYVVDLAKARGITRVNANHGLITPTGEACMEHFQKRMKVKDIAALEQEWYAYIDTLAADSLAGLEAAGKRAFRENRRIRATRLLGEAIDAGSVDTQVYVLFAQCKAAKNDRDTAVKTFEKAAEIDPLDADVYAHHGFLLTQMKQKEKGQRLIELAREMNPDDDYLWLEVAHKLAEVSGDE